jgi:hypothetical protein
MSKIESPEGLLALGLREGFVGGTTTGSTKSASIELVTSSLHVSGGNYRDRWTKGISGGGQELVVFGGKKLTRVYAGGTIPDSDLRAMGIQHSDVMNYLKQQIVTHGDKIRLYEDFTPEPEGHWRYSYKIKGQLEYISLTVGEEEIMYDNVTVFGHVFLICPVK